MGDSGNQQCHRRFWNPVNDPGLTMPLAQSKGGRSLKKKSLVFQLSWPTWLVYPVGFLVAWFLSFMILDMDLPE
jgi:hypothetical protein